jgi:hypothetical protein
VAEYAHVLLSGAKKDEKVRNESVVFAENRYEGWIGARGSPESLWTHFRYFSETTNGDMK